MYINNKTELKDFIFRQLGSEAHKVEISETNFNDIFNKSLDYLHERTDDGVIRKLVIIDTNGETDIVLNQNIMGIRKLVTGDSFFNSSETAFISGISPVYDIFRGDDVSASSYLILNEQLDEVRRLFTKSVGWDFNTQSKRLILNETVSSIMLDMYEAEDEALLYENELFLMLLERDCWKQWYRNTHKYDGSTIGNGVTINGQMMLDSYDQLDADIKEARDNEEFDFMAPRKI